MEEPKIIFLGTNGCAEVVGKQLRGSAGFVIQVGDYQFHIDPGPGTLVRARQFGINLRRTVAVLVSHNHLSHANDINAVVSAMTHRGLDKKGVVIAPKSVVQETETMKPFFNPYFQQQVERIITPNPGQRVGIDNFEIRAIKAFHDDPYAIGFKFFTPQFVLSYSGDTKYDSELIEQYEKSDILILNVLYPRDVKGDQLNMEDAENIIKKVKPKLKNNIEALQTAFTEKI